MHKVNKVNLRQLKAMLAFYPVFGKGKVNTGTYVNNVQIQVDFCFIYIISLHLPNFNFCKGPLKPLFNV